ncbi:unnamed protein product [Rotaria socialis]|uniref:EF-hand domain-containing protein n=1 Tax=Rotaria socialis TaxID=392032 RepID=A0A820UT09_9BILA|nr:unnamed protein product [Rotaria socialis]CAF4489868.1 unnamed protein product [Rotaria socialis]CAF4492468.1 unnamed protein product [Rotaria socialis]CAF4515965.1 unnamed protein product [Rotaria socialis]
MSLFQRFDNGNGILSLAEVDRTVIHWYPEFGTNRQAMIRAFNAADTSRFKEFQRLIGLLYYYTELSNLFGQLNTNKDENDLREEFNRIDINHGKYILFNEVRSILYVT